MQVAVAPTTRARHSDGTLAFARPPHLGHCLLRRKPDAPVAMVLPLTRYQPGRPRHHATRPHAPEPRLASPYRRGGRSPPVYGRLGAAAGALSPRQGLDRVAGVRRSGGQTVSASRTAVPVTP